MKKLFLLAFITAVACSFSFGQGTIRGKVTDENGEPLIGALVKQSNTTRGGVTDLDGNYSIALPDTTPQVLVISFLGYETKEETVLPVKGKVVVRDITLKPKSAEIKEVVVEAKASRAKDYYMEKVKMNSSATLDYISAETMKKTGDANVVAAVARVPGVSTNRGFITVRGIGDRYIKTTINGLRIPTLDPFTNNIKLDLLPASLIDNIIITKTASPDLPGDWAGAYLSIETKDYPEKLAINVETSFGYNAPTSFKEVLSSKRSSTDWLGYDNGFRNIDHTNYASPVAAPTPYQQMLALGLGDYYRSLGVSSSSWNTTFFNLGLVQLGLLQSSQLDDQAAIDQATDIYNTTYRLQAFDILNEKAVKFGQSVPNNWNTTTRKAPLNYSQSFSIGNQVNLFKRPLGYIAGFRYGSSIQYDPNSTTSRIDIQADTVRVLSEIKQQQNSMETNGWSALLNIAYKLNSNHSVSLLFMPNFIGVNNVRAGASSLPETLGYGTGDSLTFKNQFYEERRQLVYQFKSEHYFPRPKIKIELNASYTSGKSSVPDFKNLQFLYQGSENSYVISSSYPLQRIYRYLSENLFDSRLSAELPLGEKPGLTRKLKFGGAYQSLDRKTDQYEYSLSYINSNNQSSTGITRGVAFNGYNLTEYLSTDNFGITSGTDGNGIPYHAMDFSYGENRRAGDHNIGLSEIGAGFIMLDYALIPALRVSGGLRVEKAYMYTDALKYDTLGYAADDPRRYRLFPGRLNELSYLPSANMVCKLKNSKEAPINLRLNYSQTVARPSLREISAYAAHDYELRSPVVGNPGLRMVRINNYDLRLESYFKSEDNVSLSVFYKDFKNHIELSGTNGYTWLNVDGSSVKGIELEGKKSFKKYFEFRANVTLVNSISVFDQYAIDINPQGELVKGAFYGRVSRPMFGQAPYVVNGIFTYKTDSLGLTVAAGYNVQGPKLVIAGIISTPDVYERPRHLLDFKVSKTLGKHFSLSFTWRDLVNSPVRRTYRRDGKWYNDYDSFRYGSNYLLGVSYKI